LERLQRLAKYKNIGYDLNRDVYRKIENPKSFEYDQYFDGFEEH